MKNYSDNPAWCKNCGEPTHFADWTVQSTDTLRRKRMGLCKKCWIELKQSEDYVKLCEKMGWSVEPK